MSREITLDGIRAAALDAAGMQRRASVKDADPLYMARLSCALVVALLGLAVLAGWTFGYKPLMTVLPGFASMKANTALSFVAAGLALASIGQKNDTSHRLAALGWTCVALIPLVLGGLSLIEYLFGVQLHVDQFFFHDPFTNLYPGRMSFISGLCFCLGSGSLLLQSGSRRGRLVGQALSLLLALAALAAIVGYLYGVPILYGTPGYTAMALHTGACFLLLGVGLVLTQPESLLIRVFAAQENGGLLGRRLLAGAILAPVVLGWVYLRPAMNFGEIRFAMALFAVTLAVISTVALTLLAMFLNRSERQQADFLRSQQESAAMVRQSERELRLVTDHLPTLLSYIDRNGRFLRVNRTYERWMGREASEIIGKTIRQLLGDAYCARAEDAREAVLRGETITFETAYPTIDGDRQAQVTYAPDFDVTGEVRGIACMVLDVEEHRRTESALRQSEKLAVVGRMASSIAHEINNPLEAVTNLLYLASLDLDREGEAAGYVAQAQEQLQRVSQIVIETLRFHRQATQPTLCRVSDIVEQVLVLHQSRLAHAGIQVERRFRDRNPLLCRDGELRQVLANLVSNAADAMSSGGRLLLRTREAIDPASGRRGVVIVAADTGHGIRPETREKLFEPFHSTKGDTGSGLGLWISKEIIERHSGRIRVRSVVDDAGQASANTPELSLLTTQDGSERPGQPTREGDRRAASRNAGTVFRAFLPHAAHPSSSSQVTPL